jgi:hypothetical protein
MAAAQTDFCDTGQNKILMIKGTHIPYINLSLQA